MMDFKSALCSRLKSSEVRITLTASLDSLKFVRKSDRSVSLLVIEKNLVDLLSKEEQLSLEESDSHFSFLIQKPRA